MAAPNLKFLFNVGTESIPVWREILTTQSYYFTGEGSSSSSQKSIIAPSTEYKVADEVWIANTSTYEDAEQASSYENDLANSVNTNVFAIQFDDYPTVLPPEITMWDSSTYDSTNKQCLGGSTPEQSEYMQSNSWFRGCITASNVVDSASVGTFPTGWKTQLKDTTTFQLKGDTYKLTADSSIDAGSQVRFLMTQFVPTDANPGTTGHDPVLTVRVHHT